MEPTTAAAGAMEIFVSPWTVAVMFCAWWMIQIPRRAWPHRFKGRVMGALTSAAAVVLCVSAMQFDGPWVAESAGIAERVLLGLGCGAITANLHSFARKLGIQGLMKLEPLKETPLDLHRVIEKERD